MKKRTSSVLLLSVKRYFVFCVCILHQINEDSKNRKIEKKTTKQQQNKINIKKKSKKRYLLCFVDYWLILNKRRKKELFKEHLSNSSSDT